MSDRGRLRAPGPAVVRGLAAALAVALAALAAHRAQLGLGFVGHDTLPVILTARVRSATDLAELVTRKLMEDRFALDYWRPVLNATVALDERLFGLAPRGYQLDSMLLFAAACVALLFLARRALAAPGGRGAWVGPLLGALVFALHPSHVDVLPIVPRRHETLATLFAALALATQLAPRALAARRPPLLPGLFALLAMGSKETALALPALALCAVALWSPREGAAARLRHAAVATAASFAALALALAARFAVLGGMGGRPDRGIGLHADVAGEILQRVLLPVEPMRASPAGPLLAGAALVVATAVALRGGRPAVRRTLALGTLWAVGTAAVHSLGGNHQPWYAFLPAAGLALVLAALVDELARRRAERGALAGLVLLGALALWLLAYSPLVRAYPEWEKADRLLSRYLVRLEPELDAARPGTAVRAPALPARLVDDRPGARVTDASILTLRSLQAWTELRFPQRRFRVARAEDAGRARPDEVLVLVPRLKNVPAADVRDPGDL